MSEISTPILIMKINEMVDQAIRQYESEHQAHEATRKELEELQNATRRIYDYRMGKSDTINPSDHEVISKNIQASRERAKGLIPTKETT